MEESVRDLRQEMTSQKPPEDPETSSKLTFDEESFFAVLVPTS
jgi:hypothetical protein